jgi:exopolysaccharide biosynthesis polyprenyl glycosylphosphotransferase
LTAFSGSFKSFKTFYDHYRFDYLVLAVSNSPLSPRDLREPLFEIVNFCESQSIPVYIVPNSFDIAILPREVGTVSGIPLIRLQDAFVRPAFAIVKRIMDICIAVFVLIVGMPLWLLIAALIKLDSKGPIFFIQTRAGLHGKPFSMYKFRSMQSDAEDRLGELLDFDSLSEPVFKIKGDPRVTKIGKLLRRSSLDEIPQLINVLKGEMSLVGPRPEEMKIVKRYSPWQRRRLKAKPGITGYQQISNRGEPSLSRRIQHDLVYLKRQSLWLDLYIIIKTFSVVARGSGLTY